MQMIDIDERIRAYYGSQTLSPEVRTRLGAIESACRARRGRHRGEPLIRESDAQGLGVELEDDVR